MYGIQVTFLRTSIMVALNLLNQQQHLLPGYKVQIKFMNSQCETEHTLREVLAKLAFSDA